MAAGTSDDRDNAGAHASGPRTRYVTRVTGDGKGGKEMSSCSTGRKCEGKKDRKGRRERRERIGEREGGRKHHTRFLGERMRSVGPVSRFVSDWCRVRGSRESIARAASLRAVAA